LVAREQRVMLGRVDRIEHGELPATVRYLFHALATILGLAALVACAQ
jgi:hypothetical protein